MVEMGVLWKVTDVTSDLTSGGQLPAPALAVLYLESTGSQGALLSFLFLCTSDVLLLLR